MTQPAKHTPGPWSTFGPVKYQVYGGDPVRRIAVVDYTTGSETEEHNANAHLIAAAPAMYEAIRKVIEHRAKDYLDNTIEPYCSLVAALAQADGRQ